jgi:hypothetical protein
MLHFSIQTSDRNLKISRAKRTEAYADPQLIEDPTLKVGKTEQWKYSGCMWIFTIFNLNLVELC